MRKWLSSVAGSIGGWFRLHETYSGQFQTNDPVKVDFNSTLTFGAVFACVTLIAQDISKLRLRLVSLSDAGIWEEVTRFSPFMAVLRKPNRYQNRIEFIAHWLICKLLHGNAYILKQRDARGVVTGLYVLDPMRVRVLVADNGDVYYQLSADSLSGITEDSVTVPASEIIHDKMMTLFHPLVGIGPIYACGLAALQGQAIQTTSYRFFQNGGKPSGVLTAPGFIASETAERLKAYWDDNFTGRNVGKIAVLGDGLKYERLVMNSTDAQLLEQLRWTAENVASAFHVPAYKIGVGPLPTYQNAAIMNQIYYSDCLQHLIEAMELALDEGLQLPPGLGTEFNLDDLIRMDADALFKSNSEGIGGGWLTPDEARKRVNLPPVAGGDTPYMQQQNYSLAALAERDSGDPFALPTPAPTPEPPEPPDDEEDDEEDDEADAVELAMFRFERDLLEVLDEA